MGWNLRVVIINGFADSKREQYETLKLNKRWEILSYYLLIKQLRRFLNVTMLYENINSALRE